VKKRGMPPDAAKAAKGPPPEGPAPLAAGQAAHFRSLESLYRHAPVNQLFRSEIEIDGPGRARIAFEVEPATFHAAGAAHGTLYFKMMDDAAFYACNSLVSDRFLLTTAFNLVFTRPLKPGPMIAEGRWISGKRRVFVGEARLVMPDGEEAARGTGTFMRSHIALSSLEGYRPA
jgi:acyl-coenzyme A thioesterase PaaI-like protein